MKTHKLDTLQQLKIPDGVEFFSPSPFINNLRLLILPTSLQYFFTDKSLEKKIKDVINHSSLLFRWWVNNHKYNGQTLGKMKNIHLSKYTNSDGKPFTKINYDTFSEDAFLHKIFVGTSITTINSMAFHSCCNLKHIELGENINFIGDSVFANCPKLASENFISHSSVLFDWWVEHHKYDHKTLSEMETIDLDQYTNSDGKPFTIISTGALNKCYCAKNLLLSKTIKQVNEQMFLWCKKMKNIQIVSKDILFDLKAFNNLSASVNFYVQDEAIKKKVQALGIDSKRIFIGKIPVEQLTV